MNETARILCAISSKEDSTPGDILAALTPRTDWHSVFVIVKRLEEQGLVKLTRHARRLYTFEITPLGAERAREAKQEQG